MSAELKFILASIGAGAIGLVVGVSMLTALLPDVFGDKEGIVAAVILIAIAAALVRVLQGSHIAARTCHLPPNCTLLTAACLAL